MQSKIQSLIESCTNTAIGFVLALLVQIGLTWMMDIPTSVGQDFVITCIFTIISILRSYTVRRAFNAIHGRPQA